MQTDSMDASTITPTPTRRAPFPLSWLRWVAIVEATSFLLLLVATVVKYALDRPEGVEVLGPVHGVLFIAYVAMAFLLWRAERWKPLTFLTIVAGSIIPLGGFYVERRYLTPNSAATT